MDISSITTANGASASKADPSITGVKVEVLEADTVIDGIKVSRNTMVVREAGSRGRLLRLLVLPRDTRIQGKLYRHGSSVTLNPHNGHVIDGTLVDGRHVRSPY